MLFEYCRVLDCLHYIERSSEVCSRTRTVYDYEIDLYLTGERRLIVDDKRYEITPGSCAVRRPGELVTGIGSSHDAFCLTVDLCSDARVMPFDSRKSVKPIRKLTRNPVLDGLPSVFTVEHIQIARELFEELTHLCLARRGGSDRSPERLCAEKLWAERLILFLASEAINIPAVSSPLRPEVAEARRLISADFAEELSVSALAKKLGFSTEHFIRVFKKDCGITPAEYLIRVRMENARYMLRTADAPIKTVALSCGYTSFSLFSMTFKKHCGMTPGEYRRRSNGG